MIWLLITLVGFLSAYLFAWWMIPFVAVFFCLTMGKTWTGALLQALLAGMAINAGLIVIATYHHGFVVFDPLAQIIMLPSGWVLALITVLIGGILAGLGGAVGYSLRTISKKRST
jgi:hypothetical protein